MIDYGLDVTFPASAQAWGEKFVPLAVEDGVRLRAVVDVRAVVAGPDFTLQEARQRAIVAVERVPMAGALGLPPRGVPV